MLRVLVLQDQLVARPGQHRGAGALVGDADRPAPRGIRGDQVRGVLDRRPGDVPPGRPGGVRSRGQPVGAQPESRHPGRRERQRHLGRRAVRPPPDPLGQRRYRAPGVVQDLQPAGAVRRDLHRDPGQPVPRPGQPVDDRHRPGGRRCWLRRGDSIPPVPPWRTPRVRGAPRPPGPLEVAHGVAAGGGGELPRLPPAAGQVQVHLVGLDAGDGVVVGAVGQQPPGLVQRDLRVRRPGQPGQGAEPLGLGDRGLDRPLGLLGVDVGDVLAGVHRVHVPGLRGDPGARRGPVTQGSAVTRQTRARPPRRGRHRRSPAAPRW